MHRSTSRRLSLAAVAVGSLLAAGCTGTSSPDADGGGGGDANSIKWLIEEPEDAAALDALEQHVATFTEESGIEVQIDTLPFDTMRTVLQTQLRSGEGPDVFNWGSGPGFGGALAEGGLVADMTEAYEENGWEVYDFAKERVTDADGKIYGVPGELETIGVFYNKDIFAELGLEEPQSMADLEASAAAVKDAGLVPFAAPDKEGWEGGHYVSMAMASDVGAEEMLSIIEGEQSWESEPVVSAFEVWKEFNDQGWLSESPTSVDYDTGMAAFYSGDAAMVPTGSWLVGEIDDNMDAEVGYIPFPGPDGAGTFTAGLGSGPFVSEASSKKDAAMEFVDFLASPEHGEWTVENLHTIPPIPVDTSAIEASPLFAKVLEDTATLAESGDFGHNIDVLASDEVNQAMYDGMQGVLTGQLSAEEAAAGMAAAADK